MSTQEVLRRLRLFLLALSSLLFAEPLVRSGAQRSSDLWHFLCCFNRRRIVGLLYSGTTGHESRSTSGAEIRILAIDQGRQKLNAGIELEFDNHASCADGPSPSRHVDWIVWPPMDIGIDHSPLQVSQKSSPTCDAECSPDADARDHQSKPFFFSSYLADFSARNGIGLFSPLGLSSWMQIIFGVLALDLFAYFAHVMLHKSWLGWQFHRVHHSENAVDVTTAFRQHPGETVWRIVWQLAAIVLFGIPLWVVIVYLTFSGLNAELEHANIRLNPRIDWFLRLLTVTPNMHKVHHSRDQIETDSDY